MTSPIAQRINGALDCMPFYHFFTGTPWMSKLGQPEVCDFLFGNPHEMPLPSFVEALQRWSAPQMGYEAHKPDDTFYVMVRSP